MAARILPTFARRSASQRTPGGTHRPLRDARDARPLPPFLFVSVERGNASHRAAERLAGLIREANGRADSLLLEGRSHFTANHLLALRGTPRVPCFLTSSGR